MNQPFSSFGHLDLRMKPSASPAPTVRRAACAALLALAAAAGTGRARAECIELRTRDAQVLRGEVVFITATEVQFRTPFGVLRVPRKELANPEVLAPYLIAAEPSGLGIPTTFDGKLDEAKILVARLQRLAPPPLTPQENAQISEWVGTFAAADAPARRAIVDHLKELTPKSNRSLSGSYRNPEELATRVELLAALVRRGNAGAIPILSELYNAVRKAWEEKRGEKPKDGPLVPQEGRVRRNQRDVDRESQALGEQVRRVESYFSDTGGPGAAMVLMRIYAARYAEPEPPLADPAEDARRLLATALEDPAAFLEGRPSDPCSWTNLEKALVAESAIPALHPEVRGTEKMARNLLAAILPTTHPAWNATHAEWAAWWREHRAEVIGNQ